MSGLRSVEDQLARVLAAAEQRSRPVETVPVAEALGRTLAAPVRARSAVPVFDNSAMDGFAVRYDDVAGADADHPIALRVTADVPAGSPLDPPIAPGTAVRIMTGAVVPTAADTVVPFEHTVGGLADSLETAVVRTAPRSRGDNIRCAAGDIAAGRIVLEPGVELAARRCAALAATGIEEVPVIARPCVVVVSTGTELVPPGSPLRRGQIPESNSILLAGLAAEAGAEVVLRGTVDDTGHGPAEIVAEAGRLRADAVVFSGGVSAGAYEVVRQSIGDAMEFTRVAMQPGKPQGFGVTADGMLLFGLPGNPVAAAVSFEAFVRPALLAMQGRARVHRPAVRMPAAEGWRSPQGRAQFVPVVVNRAEPSRPVVRPATRGGSGSHLAAGLGVADAWAVIPADVDVVDEGDLVEVREL